MPLESTIVSHAALLTRRAVHGGAASALAVEITSLDDRCDSPATAESMTRAGVTAITLDGGASNSEPTLQLMRTARPATGARRSRIVEIGRASCRERGWMRV